MVSYLLYKEIHVHILGVPFVVSLRNYHVFYYLLGGADVVLKKECRLESDYWTYLTHGRLKIDVVNVADEFHRLKRSLSMLGFSQELQTK